jgi:hypothetical protein
MIRIIVPTDVGKDVDEEIISSCVVTPADAPKIIEAGPKLTKNQQTMYSILRDAGHGGPYRGSVE